MAEYGGSGHYRRLLNHHQRQKGSTPVGKVSSAGGGPFHAKTPGEPSDTASAVITSHDMAVTSSPVGGAPTGNLDSSNSASKDAAKTTATTDGNDASKIASAADASASAGDSILQALQLPWTTQENETSVEEKSPHTPNFWDALNSPTRPPAINTADTESHNGDNAPQRPDEDRNTTASPLSDSFDEVRADIDDAFGEMSGVISGKGSLKVQAEKEILISMGKKFVKKPFVTNGWLPDVPLYKWIDDYGKGVRKISLLNGQIVHLDLYRAELKGNANELAPIFGGLDALEDLNIQGNPEIEGCLEDFGEALSRLRRFNISDTSLSGHLGVFASWEKCEEIIACRCALIRGDDGLLPLLPMEALKKVEVSDTKGLRGLIPDEFAERMIEVVFNGTGLRRASEDASLHKGLYPFFVLTRDAILELKQDEALPLHSDEKTQQKLLKLTRVYQPFNSYHFEGVDDAQDERYVSRDNVAYISQKGIDLRCIKALVSSYPDIQFWWMAAWSIPREGDQLWQEAKLSLPYYVKVCGSFFVTGDSSSTDSHLLFDHPEGIEGSGWARLERLCSCLPFSIELHTSGSMPSGRKKQGPQFKVITDVSRFDACGKRSMQSYTLGKRLTWQCSGDKAVEESTIQGESSEFHSRLDPMLGSFASADERGIAGKISRLLAERFAVSELRDSALRQYRRIETEEDAASEADAAADNCQMQ